LHNTIPTNETNKVSSPAPAFPEKTYDNTVGKRELIDCPQECPMEGRYQYPNPPIVFMERKKRRNKEGEHFTSSGLSLHTVLELTRIAHCIVLLVAWSKK